MAGLSIVKLGLLQIIRIKNMRTKQGYLLKVDLEKYYLSFNISDIICHIYFKDVRKVYLLCSAVVASALQKYLKTNLISDCQDKASL